MTERLLPKRDEANRRIVRLPEAIFLDLDRCALDTRRAFDMAVQATAYNTPITGPQMYAEYKRAKREKRSYNVVGYINHELEQLPGDYNWKDDIEPHFIELGRRDSGLLMPGTQQIIDFATKNEYHLGVFTYGASSPDRNDQKWEDAKTWQLAKAAACREFDGLPTYVCNQRQKGAHIARWYREGDGLYLPDELTVEEGVQTVAELGILLDDKTDSFTGKESHLYGVRITPEDQSNQLEYQKGELPTGVVAVDGMTEALGALKSILAMRTTRS